MAPWELLLSVRIPFTGPTEFAKEFKQAPRRDDDIAIVNAGAFMHVPKSLSSADPAYNLMILRLLSSR
jgi:xanthine dehydrogenase iron-sulfur cluster and FAD-binding subunit A